jgi:hypothetical protein
MLISRMAPSFFDHFWWNILNSFKAQTYPFIYTFTSYAPLATTTNIPTFNNLKHGISFG